MKVITYFYRVFFYFFLLNIDEVVSRIIRLCFDHPLIEQFWKIVWFLRINFLENKPVIALQFLFSRFVRVLMIRE